jgi:hypothetical protein
MIPRAQQPVEAEIARAIIFRSEAAGITALRQGTASAVP